MIPIDLQEMLVGDLVRLRYIIRYSNCRRVHDENVAEHSFYTALYAFLIACHLEGEVSEPRSWGIHLKALKWGDLFGKAILHDCEEARSGDFPRPFKYHSRRLKELLDSAACTAMISATINVFPNDPGVLVDIWKEAKDDSYEGRIVEFADCLSVISYLYQEREAGNYGIHEHAEDVQSYFSKFSDPKFDFIRDLVQQAERIVRIITAPRPALLGGPGEGDPDQCERESEGSNILHLDEVPGSFVLDVHPGGPAEV